MACGTNKIKTRSEMKSKFDDKIIRELMKHPEYREVPVLLEDGKLAFIMVCDECKFVPIKGNQPELISKQLSNALKAQLEFEGKLPDLVEELLKVKNYTVLRKAETAEVVAALRGN